MLTAHIWGIFVCVQQCSILLSVVLISTICMLLFLIPLTTICKEFRRTSVIQLWNTIFTLKTSQPFSPVSPVTFIRWWRLWDHFCKDSDLTRCGWKNLGKELLQFSSVQFIYPVWHKHKTQVVLHTNCTQYTQTSLCSRASNNNTLSHTPHLVW